MLKAGRKQEIALPIEAVRAIRITLTGTLGEAEAARVLQQVGISAGRALTRRMAGAPGAADEPDVSDLRAMPRSVFWRRFSDALASRGWGRVEHAPGDEQRLGELRTHDWAEVDTSGEPTAPRCHFTSGMLGGMLSEVAGGDVAVAEIECRSRGDEQCRFVYGAAEHVDARVAAATGASTAGAGGAATGRPHA